jgi:hypothetical protein
MSTITRNTRLIEVETGTYPLYLPSLSERVPNTQFPSKMEAADLLEWGYEEVLESDVPAGDVVTEGAPEQRNGSWYRVWNVRDYTAGELATNLAVKKAALLAEAETLRIARFDTGFPYQFGENVYHVQIRVSDRQNITALRVIAKEAVEANQPLTFPFRVYENVNVTLTAAEMVDVANAAFKAVSDGYGVIWTFKDTVTAATSLAELPVAPVELFTL